MRISIVAPFAIRPKGTVSVRILPIAKTLVKRGHEVAIIIPPYDNLSHSGVEYEIDGVKICNVVFRDLKVVKYVLTPLKIVGKIFSSKPDVVYVFKPKGYSGLVAMFLATVKRLGFVKDFRVVLDADDWEGYGGFNDYYLANSTYPKLMLDFFDFQERWIPGRVDAITVASKTLKKRYLRWVSPSKVFYVPNGAGSLRSDVKSKDVDALKKKLNLENTPIILLYTRFFEYRIQKVVEVLKRVKEELSNVKLLIVGKSEFGEEEELKHTVAREELGDSVVFAGWIQPADLPEYLAVGDVAIYPFDDTTLNRAKCPGKLVELMAAGKAIVADRVGQIEEYIEDGKSGILVDSNDVEMFSSNVVKILRDRPLRKTLCENAQKRILSVFDWDTLMIKVERALFEGCTQPSACAP